MPTSFTRFTTPCTTTAPWICRLSTWISSRTGYTHRRPHRIRQRSAQTALYTIEAMVRFMAPILSFTAEEIWGFMPPVPGQSGQHPRGRTAPAADLPVGQAFAENWKRILSVQGRGHPGAGIGSHPKNYRPSAGCRRDPRGEKASTDQLFTLRRTICGRFSLYQGI